MSGNPKDPQSLGDQIRSIVSDAVHSMDYDELNKNITNTVNRALEEVRENLQHSAAGTKYASQRKYLYESVIKDTAKGTERFQNTQNTQNAQNMQNARNVQNMQSAVRREVVPQNKFPVAKRPKGYVSGTLYTVFGVLGLGTSAILFIIFLFISIFNGLSWIPAVVLMALFTVAFSIMMAGGFRIKGRLKRFEQYLAIMKDKTFCSFEELSQRAHRDVKFLKKDLQYMITEGMFPDGQIDGDYFFGDYGTYKHYIDAKEGYQSRQAETSSEENRKDRSDISPAVRAAAEKGRAHMQTIRAINAELSDPDMTRKLGLLETVVGKIIARVEERNDLLAEIDKFMDYYLPTTEKLLRAYKDFDREPIQGENIIKSKKEIEKTIDTINGAFENLLNSLYEDDAVDVKSDISVLNAMFAQEGLTGNDFKLDD